MPLSPLSASPYQVLAVSPSASEQELKRAYRRALRSAHPDTGGSAAQFTALQRAWALVGTPDARAAYDRGHPILDPRDEAVWAPSPPKTHPADTRPRTRVFGHPGGWRRQQYLDLVREWSGQGVGLRDPYDPVLVRSAPREVQHALADALAEEATARALSTLGIGYTVWHDVAASAEGGTEKIDHVVLGPAGLFALQSEDPASPVSLHRGELSGRGVAGRPMHQLAARARWLGKQARVKFSIGIFVVADEWFDDPYQVAGTRHGMTMALARSSSLLTLLRAGLPGAPRPSGNELFELRTRLQAGIRFV